MNKDSWLPTAMRGTYAKWMLGKPDEEGFSYMGNQNVANILADEMLGSGYRGTGFALDPIESYRGGFDPNQRAFLMEPLLEEWASDTGVPIEVLREYLKGHELHHANSMFTGKKEGNKGQMSTKIRPNKSRAPLEITQASIENWLDFHVKQGNYSKEQVPEERGAQRAGLKRLSNFVALNPQFKSRRYKF